MSKARLRAVLMALGFLLPLRASAQDLIAPGDAVLAGAQLLVADVDANKAFWVALGGTPAAAGVTFGDFRIHLCKADTIGTAAGSGLNHIGLHVPDVQKVITGLAARGFKTQPGRTPQQAYVWSPGDLIQVEFLEKPDQSVPVAFHHVHVFVHAGAAGGIPEMQAWYGKMFAAVPGKRGNFVNDLLPGGEITFNRSEMPTVPSMGRAIESIGFRIHGLDGYCARLAGGATPCTRESGAARITDPWGNQIVLRD